MRSKKHPSVTMSSSSGLICFHFSLPLLRSMFLTGEVAWSRYLFLYESLGFDALIYKYLIFQFPIFIFKNLVVGLWIMKFYVFCLKWWVAYFDGCQHLILVVEFMPPQEPCFLPCFYQWGCFLNQLRILVFLFCT